MDPQQQIRVTLEPQSDRIEVVLTNAAGRVLSILSTKNVKKANEAHAKWKSFVEGK